MIVKFFKRGNGSCNATIDYLLGKDRDREHAKVLQGDPELTRQLADSLQFKNRYTVGVLSFEERDLDDTIKKEIMADFEKSLLCGLEQDQYNICWIEHKDKDRLELNFVIPKIELSTGRAMNPYFDSVDRNRINAFKDHTNAKYDLHDPNDPANRQVFTPNMTLPQDKKQLQQAITGYLMGEIEQGRVTDRQAVINAIESDLGLSIARITPNTISIKDPTNEKGRNIRLKGEIYADTFRFSKEYSTENSRASREYRENRINRIATTRTELEREIDRKREFNINRYRTTTKDNDREYSQNPSIQDNHRGYYGHIVSDNDSLNVSERVVIQEHKQQESRIDSDTTKRNELTDYSESISPSPFDRTKRKNIHQSEKSEKSRDLFKYEQRADSLTTTIGISEYARRLYNRLQHLTSRVGATIREYANNFRTAEHYNREIDERKSNVQGTIGDFNQAIRDTNTQLLSTTDAITSISSEIEQREREIAKAIRAIDTIDKQLKTNSSNDLSL